MTALLLALAMQDAAARVAELAPELEAREAARVWRAIESLAALGPDAAPLLDARAKDAPDRARPYLAIAAAEARRSADLPDGGRLRRHTITYAPQELGAILTDFGRRAGVRFSLEGFVGEELPDVGVAIRDASFIEALVAIARAAKMTPRREGEQFTMEPAPSEPPTFAYGGLLLRAEGYTQRRIVDFTRPPRNRVSLDVDLLWDPALKVVAAGPPEVLEAVDDRGRKLTVPARDPKEDEEEGAPGDFVEEGMSRIDLESPAGGVATIALLRGSIPVKLARASAALVLEKPAAGSSAKAQGFEARVVKVEPAQRTLEVEVACPGRKPEELAKIPVSATAWDSGGARVETYLDVVRGGESIKLSLNFALAHRGPAPAVARRGLPIAKLEISVAVDCIESRFPFEFRDLKIR